MNQLQTSKSADLSPQTRRPVTVDEDAIDALEAIAGRSAIDLSSSPSAAVCERISITIPALLGDRMSWEQAAYQATRLASVLPAAKADEMDRAMATTELAKALATYPHAVAEWAADHLMATKRFRPVPVDIHDAAKARQSRLRVALFMACRIEEARAAAAAERQRIEQEAEDDARAKAEGRETSSERRARIASEALAAIRSPAA